MSRFCRTWRSCPIGSRSRLVGSSLRCPQFGLHWTRGRHADVSPKNSCQGLESVDKTYPHDGPVGRVILPVLGRGRSPGACIEVELRASVPSPFGLGRAPSPVLSRARWRQYWLACGFFSACAGVSFWRAPAAFFRVRAGVVLACKRPLFWRASRVAAERLSADSSSAWRQLRLATALLGHSSASRRGRPVVPAGSFVGRVFLWSSL